VVAALSGGHHGQEGPLPVWNDSSMRHRVPATLTKTSSGTTPGAPAYRCGGGGGSAPSGGPARLLAMVMSAQS
jgi:hypothetical protein